MSNFVSAEVLEIADLSRHVRSFKLAYPNSDQFIPGQFVMLDLPIEGAFSTRSYSIASAPNKEAWIELCVVLKPGGQGSTYLFEKVGVGDELRVSEPEGRFQLIADERPLVLICTGTGIAPFRSMIHYLVSKDASREIHLVFGNRKENDILYRAEFEALAASVGSFHFIPTLSQADADWTGNKGYVHPYYLSLAEKLSDGLYYICGWTTMVKEAKNNLKALGFSRKQVKFELYD